MADRSHFSGHTDKPVSRSWRSWLLRVVFWFTGLVLAAALSLAFVVLTALVAAYPNLPEISELQDYRPKIPLRVFSSEGILIGEFGEERREFTPISAIPKLMKDAVLAAEDARFYDHNGVDFKGLVRAGYNRWASPPDRLHRQNAFDAYLVNEFAPFVRNRTSWPQMGATGCSFGGYHAVNFALRHPDIVTYAVSMSGAFDIARRFLDGYYDQNAYFHSPLDYLPNLNDDWFLERFRRNYYVLAVGNHDPLFDQNVKLAHELGVKQIPHILDVWEGFGHDWPWWQRMAAKFFG